MRNRGAGRTAQEVSRVIGDPGPVNYHASYRIIERPMLSGPRLTGEIWTSAFASSAILNDNVLFSIHLFCLGDGGRTAQTASKRRTATAGAAAQDQNFLVLACECLARLFRNMISVQRDDVGLWKR